MKQKTFELLNKSAEALQNTDSFELANEIKEYLKNKTVKPVIDFKNLEREKLKLSAKEGKNLIYGDSDEFEIISDIITSNGRWCLYHEIIIKRLSDGKYFKDTYSEGATECQDERPYEYSTPDFTEVFPVEEKNIIYK